MSSCQLYAYILKDNIFYKTPKRALTSKQLLLSDSVIDSNGKLIKTTYSQIDNKVIKHWEEDFNQCVVLCINPMVTTGSSLVFV